MTHAFFKALLFMAAGSVIAAMAGAQNLDKMGGFRKAMPFTFATMVIGGLALSGVPPFAGFFSKDEILAYVADRGDWHIALVVVGYVVAFMTAAYTFRMIFRAFLGEPVPRRASSRPGTSTTPSSRRTRSAARSRTPTSASPAPTTTSPSTRCR
jgi:NADH-quinone oxidoreductase subunit L